MVSFWQKPIFWIMLLLLLMVSIPLSAYFFKPQILSGLAYISSRIKNQQAPKPGKCLVLEEKYCSKVEFIEWTYQGQTFTLACFNLPEGVPIYSPDDGEYAIPTSGSGPYAGSYGNVVDRKGDPTIVPSYVFAGDFQPELPTHITTRPVKKGDIIGYTTNTGINNFGYSLIVRITRADSTPGQFYTPKETLERLFLKFQKKK